MLLNCGVGEASWESLGLQGDQTRKSVLNIHWKDWCGSWSSNTLATWCEERTHWKRPWCWERLKVGEGDNRGWDDWMAPPTWWTWVRVSSRSWWWDREAWRAEVHGVIESWTWLSNWTELKITHSKIKILQIKLTQSINVFGYSLVSSHTGVFKIQECKYNVIDFLGYKINKHTFIYYF